MRRRDSFTCVYVSHTVVGLLGKLHTMSCMQGPDGDLAHLCVVSSASCWKVVVLLSISVCDVFRETSKEKCPMLVAPSPQSFSIRVVQGFARWLHRQK